MDGKRGVKFGTAMYPRNQRQETFGRKYPGGGDTYLEKKLRRAKAESGMLTVKGR